MASLNIETCGDLQGMPLNVLQDNFGPKMGLQLKNFSQGKDDRVLTAQKERKSVSAEVNYGIRFKQVRLDTLVPLI
jgi:DNA repair protein REV1